MKSEQTVSARQARASTDDLDSSPPLRSTMALSSAMRTLSSNLEMRSMSARLSSSVDSMASISVLKGEEQECTDEV
jgi:hypothetical protein